MRTRDMFAEIGLGMFFIFVIVAINVVGGLRVEYRSEPVKTFAVPQTSNLVDKRNRECM